MPERPIIFSGAMVRAILAGQKGQTRRLMKPQPGPTTVSYENLGEMAWGGSGESLLHRDEFWKPIRGMREFEGGIGSEDHARAAEEFYADDNSTRRCPYGKPGDRLWVKEAWALPQSYDRVNIRLLTNRGGDDLELARAWVSYGAESPPRSMTGSGPAKPGRYRHARFMFRWASRLTLEVTGVRVQRVQEISEQDATAEGLIAGEIASARCQYEVLWNRINGKRASWKSNPWVWVIEFKRLEAAA